MKKLVAAHKQADGSWIAYMENTTPYGIGKNRREAMEHLVVMWYVKNAVTSRLYGGEGVSK